jgi:hypothetical protein
MLPFHCICAIFPLQSGKPDVLILRLAVFQSTAKYHHNNLRPMTSPSVSDSLKGYSALRMNWFSEHLWLRQMLCRGDLSGEEVTAEVSSGEKSMGMITLQRVTKMIGSHMKSLSRRRLGYEHQSAEHGPV